LDAEFIKEWLIYLSRGLDCANVHLVAPPTTIWLR